MKKIYTRSVFEFNEDTGRYELNDNDSHYYLVNDDAPVMQMKGSGHTGSNSGTTVQKTEPWAGEIPYLTAGMGAANTYFLHDPNVFAYPGQTVAGFSPETEESFAGILNRARAPNPMMDNAQGMLSDTLAGKYLTGGEGFNSALEAAKHQIIPEVQSQFESRGRAGSGLARTAEASGIGDAFSKLYEQERQNQIRAGSLVPAINAARYSDLDRIGDVGRQRQLLSQTQMEDQKNRFDYNQNIRRNLVLQYLNAIKGNYGSTVTNQTGGGGGGGLSGWQRYLAGAGGGAMSGFGMTGSPWGAAAGAGLGLLGAWNG